MSLRDAEILRPPDDLPARGPGLLGRAGASMVTHRLGRPPSVVSVKLLRPSPRLRSQRIRIQQDTVPFSGF